MAARRVASVPGALGLPERDPLDGEGVHPQALPEDISRRSLDPASAGHGHPIHADPSSSADSLRSSSGDRPYFIFIAFEAERAGIIFDRRVALVERDAVRTKRRHPRRLRSNGRSSLLRRYFPTTVARLPCSTPMIAIGGIFSYYLILQGASGYLAPPQQQLVGIFRSHRRYRRFGIFRRALHRPDRHDHEERCGT